MNADILRSVPGIGSVASTMLIAEMLELGKISGEQAAAAFEDELVVLLAGRAAEIVVLVCASAGSGGSAVRDLARATQISDYAAHAVQMTNFYSPQPPKISANWPRSFLHRSKREKRDRNGARSGFGAAISALPNGSFSTESAHQKRDLADAANSPEGFPMWAAA